MNRVQWVAAARALWGGALLAAPERTLLAGRTADHRERAVVRVLGLRHLAQAAASGADPRRVVTELGVGADVLHAASAVLFAALARRYAVPALRSAATASAWALAGTWSAGAGGAGAE